MANDTQDLVPKLATALRDETEETWTSDELTDLLTWACARTWPRLALRIRESVTLTDDRDQYTLQGVAEIDRVDLLDSDGDMVYPLPGGTWEFWSEGEAVGGTLYVNPSYSKTTYTLRVHGWGPYDVLVGGSNPPDRAVPWIMAMARSEAARRELARRYQSKNWATLDQTANVSINELVQMVNESDNDAYRLAREIKTWRRPRPATVG